MMLRIEKHGSIFKAFDISTGNENTEPRQIMMQLAYESNEVLYLAGSKWRRKSADPGAKVVRREKIAQPVLAVDPNRVLTENEMLLQAIHTSPDKRPDNIIISDLKWKFLCRSIIRGKNIMITGPAGSGKTQTALAAIRALDRPFFRFNLGASQDPKSFLIGNTHYEQGTGTIFKDSAFIKAIETENASILLDELSRAHPDAHNILMTVLDDQRYLRIDDDPNSPVIQVADGVSFIATANIGNEYTATRKLDKALKDRFNIEVEMDVLNKVEEAKLLQYKHPELTGNQLHFLTEIAIATRDEVKSPSPKLSTALSTRTMVDMAGLVADGFTLAEAAEVSVYPLFSSDGGAESERVYIKQIVQKYIEDDTDNTLVSNPLPVIEDGVIQPF